MRPVRLVGLFFMVVFLGAALVAPWLYHLAHWAARLFPALDSLAQNPFHRYLNRSLLIVALAGLWPLLRCMGLRSWADVGLGRSPRFGRLLVSGFLIGFASLASVALIAVISGSRQVRTDRAGIEILGHILGAGATAIVVASLEELFFRGALFGSLRKALSWPVAMLTSSLIYAWLHFFEQSQTGQAITWTSGFSTLVGMMRGFGDLEKLVPGFFNLTVAGIILALAYQRFGSLYFSIGLHGGWVFWLKSYGFFTRRIEGANTWLWGTSKLIDGWVALAILLVVLVVISQQENSRGNALVSNSTSDPRPDRI